MIRRPRRSTLFPYTTLFRSSSNCASRCKTSSNPAMEYPGNLFVVAAPSGAGKSSLVKSLLELDSHLVVSISHTRSEEHTSELQSPCNLVCRLLLEKKTNLIHHRRAVLSVPRALPGSSHGPRACPLPVQGAGRPARLRPYDLAARRVEHSLIEFDID